MRPVTEAASTLSNILKKSSETARSIVANIK